MGGTLECILAQRLVRRVCDDCRAEVRVDPELLVSLGAAVDRHARACRGTGCESCRGTGYRGRIGIFELLAVDDDIREALRARPDARMLRRLAIGRGMRTLREDGLRQVAEGRTTPEEVLRVTLE